MSRRGWLALQLSYLLCLSLFLRCELVLPRGSLALPSNLPLSLLTDCLASSSD